MLGARLELGSASEEAGQSFFLLALYQVVLRNAWAKHSAYVLRRGSVRKRVGRRRIFVKLGFFVTNWHLVAFLRSTAIFRFIFLNFKYSEISMNIIWVRVLFTLKMTYRWISYAILFILDFRTLISTACYLEGLKRKLKKNTGIGWTFQWFDMDDVRWSFDGIKRTCGRFKQEIPFDRKVDGIYSRWWKSYSSKFVISFLSN